jgi:UDP-glucose 4-epimerase
MSIDLAAAFGGARVLITGGLGFIGANLAERLLGLGAAVTLIDDLDAQGGGTWANIEPFRDRVRVVIADMRDQAALAPLAAADYVFSLAARTSHMGSLDDPLGDLDVNARAPLALLELCRAKPPRAIVYAGTRQIYGRAERLPVDETRPLRPPDPNGVAKMAGEAYHLLYHRLHGLPALSLRLTNTYGPRMRIKDARQNFLGLWIRRVLEGRAFEVWGGAQRRDLAYVDDVADAFLHAAAAPEARGRAFNIGGPSMSLHALAERLVAANGGGGFELAEFPPERARIDIGDYEADDSLFRKTTGWVPTVGIDEGLRRTLAYFRPRLSSYV